MSLAPLTNNSGKNFSYDPEIDGSGRYVIFTSLADNFAAPGKTEGEYHEHVYLRDSLTGTTTQLDITSDGQTGTPGNSFNPFVRTFGSGRDPHISRDGKFVVFLSPASNISPDGKGETFGNWAYLKNIESGTIQRIPYATANDESKSEFPSYLTINADGTVIIVVSIIGNVADSNCESCKWEITLYDRNTNTTTLLPSGLSGNSFNPGMSDDGEYIVFENQSGDFSNPTYSYLFSRSTNQLSALNFGKEATSPAISGDGRYIAYTDNSAIPSRIRLMDRNSGSEIIISDGLNGQEPDGISEFASLSQDGRYLAFLSTANNLVANDSNGLDDIFVYDQISGKTTLVSVQGQCENISTNEDFNTGPPSISSDGKTIAFTVLERLNSSDSKSADGSIIEPADQNSFDDVYRAEIDYDAQPVVFKKGVTPDSPLVSVNCTGKEARIQVEKSINTDPANRINPLGKKKKATAVKKISEQVIISTVDDKNKRGKIVQKLQAKRNQLTAKDLPPGNYTAQVKIDAKLYNGKTSSSKLSVPSYFTISE